MLIAEQLLVLGCTPTAVAADPRWPSNRRLASAVVAELTVMGRLRFLAGLVIPDASPTSSTVLTDALAVLERRKELSVSHAIDAIANAHTDLRQELLDSMVRRGLLQASESRHRLFWRRRTYQPVRSASQAALDPLHRFAVAGDLGDHRGAALFALADLIGLRPGLLDSGELTLGRRALQQLEADCTGTRAATDPMSERARLLLALTHPGS